MSWRREFHNMRVTFLARGRINMRCINVRECGSQATRWWWECVRSCWNIINGCSSSSQTTSRLNHSTLLSLFAMKFARRSRATYVIEFWKMWHIPLFPLFIMISDRTGITNVLKVYMLLKFRTSVQRSVRRKLILDENSKTENRKLSEGKEVFINKP
jgi:hypothetical protein